MATTRTFQSRSKPKTKVKPELRVETKPLDATGKTTCLALERASGDRVMTMFLEGFMPNEIANQTGASLGTVRSRIEEDGKNPNRYSYDELTASDWESYYSDPDDPWSVSLIASTWGVSSGLVNAALLRRGVRIRHVSLALSLAAARRKKLT